MGFLIAAEGQLRYWKDDEEETVVDANDLIEGSTEVVGQPQFKDDTTDYLTRFYDPSHQFEWSVYWSQSLSRTDVDEFLLTKQPSDIEVEDEISFAIDEQ
jgi:hypothetical protein